MFAPDGIFDLPIFELAYWYSILRFFLLGLSLLIVYRD